MTVHTSSPSPASGPTSLRWIDSHCHLPSDGTEVDIINRAVDANVVGLVVVGTDYVTSAAAISLARAARSRVRAAVGLHPHDAAAGMDDVITLLEEAITFSDRTVVGIGETGLDFFYEYSPRNTQIEVFARHINLAHKYQLPLSIHTRDAWDETFSLLQKEGVPPQSVLHCFTGGPEELQIALELGLYISFSGIVTFPKSLKVQEAAMNCPLDRMLIETDSPYLTPLPFRGKKNEPANVVLTGKFISELKKIDIQYFSESVFMTTKRVFSLDFL